MHVYTSAANRKQGLKQLCPTQMAYWAYNYVTILIRAAQWRTY